MTTENDKLEKLNNLKDNWANLDDEHKLLLAKRITGGKDFDKFMSLLNDCIEVISESGKEIGKSLKSVKG